MPSKQGQNKVIRDPQDALTDGALQRLAFTAGVVSMAALTYWELRTLAVDALTKIMSATVNIARNDKRTRITCNDVEEGIRVAHQTVPYMPRVLRSGDEGDVKRCEVGKSNTIERKVAFYQKQSACVHFSRDGFDRTIRLVSNDYGSGLQFSKDAIGILQMTIEAYLVRILAAANRLVVHAERKTLMPKDLHTANHLGRDA